MHHASVDLSRIHGIIIGIDRYKNIDIYPYLGGRNVDDATSLFRSLTDLGTPHDNLLCLFDEQATQRAILDAFNTHLIHNPGIGRGDPVIIYLAGYGNRAMNTPGWQSTEKEVEMVLPHDVNTNDSDGKYVFGVYDFTLAALLHELRQQKGHNIAIITDHFHVGTSGRGARNTRIRSSYDPSQSAFMELISEQTHKLFSNPSPPASPNITNPWRDDLMSLLGSSEYKIPTPTPPQGEKQSKLDQPEILSQSIPPSRPYKPVKLHGLIIGINEYKQSDLHVELLGCVGDAKSVLRYFTDDLGVPEDQFVCLFDEHATRDAIINTFVSHLIDNPNIKPSDPIVIYFAGHGDRMPAPLGWQSPDGKVEMILPHDASTFDDRGYYIFGIPDLTLAFLLYKLSQKKGNNITVILDSCHSGSGTRGDVRVRSSNDRGAPPIPATLDLRLRNSLSVDYPSEVEHDITEKQPAGKLMAPSLESHILLAACREDEQAQEINRDAEPVDPNNPRSTGVFTTALLKELRRSDLATTSYTTLLRNLMAHREFCPKITQPLAPQTFQCEGRNQDRLLFSVQYSVSKGKIALMSTYHESVYRVRIGSAQGIVPGTEFGVFSDKMDPAFPPLALLVARNVGPTMSLLHSLEPNAPRNIPSDAYVSIVRYNDHSNGVRIWVDERIRRNETWRAVLSSLGTLPVYWATSPGAHDIALLPYLGDVEFRGAHLVPGSLEVHHILRTSHGAKKLEEILTAVVGFYFHLKIQNPEAPVRALVDMKLRELNNKSSSWGSIIYEPKGEDLFGDSVSTGTVAPLRPDPHKAFGIEITNNSTEDLFPYVLYYDFEDYSVGCLYEPPSRSGKAPFKAGDSLTIGYGSGGTQPLEINFTNPSSENEYGAFVLMMTSKWVDITYFQQVSPFGEDLNDRGRIPAARPEIWDNVVARVQLVKPEPQ